MCVFFFCVCVCVSVFLCVCFCIYLFYSYFVSWCVSSGLFSMIFQMSFLSFFGLTVIGLFHILFCGFVMFCCLKKMVFCSELP